jgi:hypothetical protein
MRKQRLPKKHAWASSISLGSFGQSKSVRVSANHELDESHPRPLMIKSDSFDMDALKYGRGWLSGGSASPVTTKARTSYFKPDAYGLSKKNMWVVPSREAAFVRP